MKTLSHVCGVIPPHILFHVAEHPDDAGRADGLSTLEHMRELATARSRMTHPTEGAVAPQPTQKKRRNVYDACHLQKLPGKLVMSEHKPRGDDVEVTEAYDGAGITFDFFALVFGRQSIDNRGMRIDSTVHYGSPFHKAPWNAREIVYGDGDGRIFKRFTASLDVIGHELTRGVTQYTAAPLRRCEPPRLWRIRSRGIATYRTRLSTRAEGFFDTFDHAHRLAAFNPDLFPRDVPDVAETADATFVHEFFGHAYAWAVPYGATRNRRERSRSSTSITRSRAVSLRVRPMVYGRRTRAVCSIKCALRAYYLAAEDDWTAPARLAPYITRQREADGRRAAADAEKRRRELLQHNIWNWPGLR